MLVLFETPAGYALFKVLDEDRIQKVSDIIEAFNDEDSASEVYINILSKTNNPLVFSSKPSRSSRTPKKL
jgi:hypothetical protein